jgi:hypothetical protein
MVLLFRHILLPGNIVQIDAIAFQNIHPVLTIHDILHLVTCTTSLLLSLLL